MTKKKKIIFIEWSKYNTRGDSISNAINAKIFFIGVANISKNPFRSLLSYFPKAIENIKILRRERPDVVIITNTTWVISTLNFIYTKLLNIKLILDSHSCAFDHSFFKYPLFLSKFYAKHSFFSIVTNKSHQEMLKKIHAESIVLNDIPFEEKLKTDEKKDLGNKFNICYVCTFAEDEPFYEVFKAGEDLDDVQIFVTGNYKKVGINPEKFKDIIFTGFISNEEYKLYLNNTDVIMTLTTREDTMQRAGSEAISIGRPLITSNTEMLKNTFYKGAVFVDNTSKEIRKGIEKTKSEYEFLKKNMLELQHERKNKFNKKLQIIKNKLEIE